MFDQKIAVVGEQLCALTLLQFGPKCPLDVEQTEVSGSAPGSARHGVLNPLARCKFTPMFLHATFAEQQDPNARSVARHWVSGLQCRKSLVEGDQEAAASDCGGPTLLDMSKKRLRQQQQCSGPVSDTTVRVRQCEVVATDAQFCKTAPQAFGYHFAISTETTTDCREARKADGATSNGPYELQWLSRDLEQAFWEVEHSFNASLKSLEVDLQTSMTLAEARQW